MGENVGNLYIGSPPITTYVEMKTPKLKTIIDREIRQRPVAKKEGTVKSAIACDRTPAIAAVPKERAFDVSRERSMIEAHI